MADKSGCTAQYISFIENGRVDGGMKFWRKLSQMYNIPEQDIFNYMKKY